MYYEAKVGQSWNRGFWPGEYVLQAHWMAQEMSGKRQQSQWLGDMAASADFLQVKSKTIYDVLVSKPTARSFLTLK